VILNALTAILLVLISAVGTIWAAKLNGKVKEVHVLVNNQLQTVMDKNTELTAEVKYQKTQPAEDP